MAFKTREQLQAEATQIANETAKRANTASRIGNAILDVIDSSGAYVAQLSETATGAVNAAALLAAFTAAIAAGGTKAVSMPAGTFPMDCDNITGIAQPNGVYLRGAGMYATVLDFSGKSGYNYDVGMIRLVGGGLSNQVAVSSTVAMGSLVIPVASSTGYASGDIVQIRSTENYVVSDGGTRAEFLRVRYTDATHIYVTTPTQEVYNTGLGTVTVAKVAFSTGGWSDFTLKGKGSNPLGWPTPNQYTSAAEVNDSNQNTRSDYGIECIWGRDLLFSNLRFVDVENQPITMQACYGFDVSRCSIEFSAIQERSQYGVAIYRATSEGRISDNFCINCRHFCTTGHTSSTSQDYYFGVPHNVTIQGNVVLGAWQDGIDLHRGGHSFTIVGNVVQGYYAGIKTRACRVTIADNIIIGPNAIEQQSSYDAIQVQFNCTDVKVTGNKTYGHACGLRLSSPDADFSNVTIQDNSFNTPGQYGVRITSDAFTGSRIKIDGNLIDSPALYGVYIDGNFTDVSVNGNTINGGTYGIRTLATGTRTGLSVCNNILRGQTNDPIYLELCNSITVNGNQLYGANTNGVHLRVRDCKRGTVIGNHITIPSGSSGGSGIFINCTSAGACQDIVIDENEVYSPSGVGTGISFDSQPSQYHTVGESNNCRTCATPVATDSFSSIRNQMVRLSSLTVASGFVTVESKARQFLVIDTAAAASGLVQRLAYSGLAGDMVFCRAASAARPIVFKDNTENLRIAGDFSPSGVDSVIGLVWGGSVWNETGRSNN